MTAKPVKVLIVDDSALVRQMLTAILTAAEGLEVVGAAPDPLVAREMIKRLNPDVVTLDIEMPRMDGIAFLEKIMTLRPMPVVMVSSLTQEGADATLKALELGAVDFVAKPTLGLQEGLANLEAEIVAKIRAAGSARVQKMRPIPKRAAAKPGSSPGHASTEQVIAVGASTGGVQALSEVVHALPADCPAVLVTQHMPAGFTRGFADRLNGTAAVAVSEVQGNERALPGHVYIAPGGRHLELARSGADFVCRLTGSERVSGHCPSVNVLFSSAAKAAGGDAVGVILTGMGQDGAAGLKKMREAGAKTFGQDEASCVVYGMPKAAMETGAVERQLPLSRIANAVLEICARRKVGSMRV